MHEYIQSSQLSFSWIFFLYILEVRFMSALYIFLFIKSDILHCFSRGTDIIEIQVIDKIYYLHIVFLWKKLWIVTNENKI